MNIIFAIAGVVLREMYRRKDFYVLFVLTVLITGVMASVNVFNDDRIVRYLKALCLTLIWISSLVAAITMTARQIPAEKESRTLFPLLAKPVTRTQLLLGKFLGCWLASGAALICFYLFFGLLSASREHAWPLLNYFQAIVFHWLGLGIVIAMVLAGSLVFAAPSSNATICFVVAAGIHFLARHLNQIAVQMTEPGRSIVYVIYYLVPHLEFFDLRALLVHNWHLVPWTAWMQGALYGAVYIALFLVAGCVLFRRKALN